MSRVVVCVSRNRVQTASHCLNSWAKSPQSTMLLQPHAAGLTVGTALREQLAYPLPPGALCLMGCCKAPAQLY